MTGRNLAQSSAVAHGDDDDDDADAADAVGEGLVACAVCAI